VHQAVDGGARVTALRVAVRVEQERGIAARIVGRRLIRQKNEANRAKRRQPFETSQYAVYDAVASFGASDAYQPVMPVWTMRALSKQSAGPA